MNLGDHKKGQPYIDAYKELNSLFERPVYSAADKKRILELMGKFKLTGTRPQNPFLEFRKIRGQLFGTRSGKKVVVANGRGDWVGWIELKTEEIEDKAIANTARVLAAVDADIQVLCEIEDRPSLVQFHDGVLEPILLKTARKGYPYILLIDGNDPRGIDVAILSRHPVFDISTHVFDLPGAIPIFSRDCAEFFVQVPGLPKPCIVMANHFTSKGSDPTGLERRLPQSTRVRAIVDDRTQQGFAHIVVAGDLNDTPTSQGLHPLIGSGTLTDALKQFGSQIDPTGKRLGTYETGLQQLDYLMVTPALKALAKGAGVERRGHYSTLWKPWEGDSRYDASDHHALWVDMTV